MFSVSLGAPSAYGYSFWAYAFSVALSNYLFKEIFLNICSWVDIFDDYSEKFKHEKDIGPFCKSLENKFWYSS